MRVVIVSLFFITSLLIAQNNITNTIGAGGNFVVKDATTDFFTIQQSNGNVGIAKTPGAYKVDVSGDVNVSGNFKVNGTNIPTSAAFSVAWITPPSINSGQYLSASGSTNSARNCMIIIPKSGNTISLYVAVGAALSVTYTINVLKATISTGDVSFINTGITATLDNSHQKALATGSYSYSAGDVFVLQLFSASGAFSYGLATTVVFE